MLRVATHSEEGVRHPGERRERTPVMPLVTLSVLGDLETTELAAKVPTVSAVPQPVVRKPSREDGHERRDDTDDRTWGCQHS